MRLPFVFSQLLCLVHFRADVDLPVGCIYCYRQQVHYYQQLCVGKNGPISDISWNFVCCQAKDFHLRPDISSVVSFLSLSCCHLGSCWTPSDEWLHLTSLSDFDWSAWLLSPGNCYIGPVTDVQYSHARDVIATCLSVGWSVCMCARLRVCFLCACVFAE